MSFVTSVKRVGFDVEPRLTRASARDQRGALVDTRADEAEDAVALLGRDHRAANRDAAIQAVAHRHLRYRGGHALVHLREDRTLHQQPAAGRAHLARVPERRPHRGDHRGVEVGILEHDVRVLAAEFERDALEILGRRVRDDASHLGRAGEGDLRDAGMLGECRPDAPVSGQHAHDAVGNTGALQDACHAQQRQRGVRRGLGDNGQPAASAGAILNEAVMNGKFHGRMIATGPTGSIVV